MLNKKNQIPKILFAFTVIFIFQSFAYAYIMGNDGDCAYEDGKTTAIESNIEEGAAYFLQSYSDTLLLLNRVELAGVNGMNYTELREILYRAVENMEKAKDAYTLLTDSAADTSYNPVFIKQLMLFDYAGLQKETGISSTIFDDVEVLLAKGDVTAVFSRILAGSGTILDTLYKVKDRVDAGLFPTVSTLWHLNTTYAQTMMFGQAAAGVFASVKGNLKDACE